MRRRRIGIVGLYIESLLLQARVISKTLVNIYQGNTLSDIVEEILFGKIVTH